MVQHGCQGGTISELIYYHDTSAFYEKYQDEIWDKLEDTRADMGLDSILQLVATFHGHVGSDLQLRNLLACYLCRPPRQEIPELQVTANMSVKGGDRDNMPRDLHGLGHR